MSNIGVEGAEAFRKENRYGKSYWYRLRDDELGRCGDGRGRTESPHQRRGQSHHSLGSGFHRQRGTPGRPDRQTPGDHQPGEYYFFHQAADRPPLRGGGGTEGYEDIALQNC